MMNTKNQGILIPSQVIKDRISVEIKSAVRIPKETYRRVSLKCSKIYYEFSLPWDLIESQEDIDKFYRICDNMLEELDEKYVD